MSDRGPRHGIHDTVPAARWEDGFLSGNGECGLIALGDPTAERLIVNHHRFVLPNGSRQMAPPAVADRLGEVRDLVLAGAAKAAQRAFTDGRRLAWTQPFHPGFVIEIDRANPPPAGDYRRETDFRTGEVSATWTDAGGVWRSRGFVSRADRVLVYELAGTALDLAVRLSGDLPGRPADVGYSCVAEAGDAREVLLTVRGTYPPGLGAFGFVGVTRLVAVDGPVRVDGAAAVVRGASRLLLLTVLDRADGPVDEEPLRERLESLPADYLALLRRHVAVHTPMYERVELDLGVADERVQSVGELLAAQRQADAPTPALLEAMFHAGRYLLISSSGVLPPRLTGLWLGEWGAAWSGDFTTDANVNLQLAGANIGALPEALIADQIDDWRDNARAVFGARGVLAPSRTDGEHGRLFHLNADWPWAMWVAGADWLLFPLLEHWQVTGDDAFLADPLAPWLVEAALFFEDFLALEDEHGFLVLVPSYSPEVGPSGRTGVAAVNATMDIAAARHALSAAVETCTRLGIEETAVARWPLTWAAVERSSAHAVLRSDVDVAVLRQAIELTALIREAAGPDVELLIDAHGRFDVPNAIRIGQALDEVGGIHWYEEPVPPESYRALEQVRGQVRVPISVGERLHTRWDFVPVLENRLADFVMPDVTWTGGISELKKIATMAEAYYVPVSPHDAAGPVNLVAGGHVMITVPNFYRIESSRHDLSGYNRFLTTPLDNRDGRLTLPPGPGLGLDFDLDYLRRHARDG